MAAALPAAAAADTVAAALPAAAALILRLRCYRLLRLLVLCAPAVAAAGYVAAALPAVAAVDTAAAVLPAAEQALIRHDTGVNSGSCGPSSTNTFIGEKSRSSSENGCAPAGCSPEYRCCCEAATRLFSFQRYRHHLLPVEYHMPIRLTITMLLRLRKLTG